MLAASRIRQTLTAEGATSFGAWQLLPGATHARSIAECGFDWVLVDCEHGNIDDSAMHLAVSAIAAIPSVSPIVRIADNQGWMIKRALDAGAHGILVPLIYTVEDAQKLVKSAKFPPQGQRGFGSPFPMRNTGVKTANEYLLQANESLVVAVQIETQEALDRVAEIAQVPGIDVLFVGPFDLGNNIGRPVLEGKMHPVLEEAIDRIHAAAVANGKRSGIYCTDPEQARKYALKGFHMISVFADVSALTTALSNGLSTARHGETGEARLSGPYGK